MCRGYAARSKFARLRAAAVTVQRMCRGYAARSKFARLRAAAVTVQRMCRGYAARSSFARLRVATVALQCVWRGRAARRELASLRATAAATAAALQVIWPDLFLGPTFCRSTLCADCRPCEGFHLLTMLILAAKTLLNTASLLTLSWQAQTAARQAAAVRETVLEIVRLAMAAEQVTRPVLRARSSSCAGRLCGARLCDGTFYTRSSFWQLKGWR